MPRTRPIVWTLVPFCVLALVASPQAALSAAPGEPPAVGPFVRHETAGVVTVCWGTDEPCPSVVVVSGKGLAGKRFEDKTPKTRHSVTISPLASGSAYRYQVFHVAGGRQVASGEQVFDTTFNYGVEAVPEAPEAFGGGADAGRCAAAAERILKQTKVDRGFCVVYGLGSGQLAWELARRSRLIVVCVDEDAARVAAAQGRFKSAGVYGTRITAVRASLSKTSLPSCFANLVVSERMLAEGACPGTAREVMRLLRPAGGVMYLGQPAGAPVPLRRPAMEAYLRAGGIEASIASEDGLWASYRRPPPAGAGVWSHQYGTAANASCGGEALGGAGRTGDLAVQWVGRPGADFGVDRQVRMPAPLSAGGRLYHQGFHRMVALDAYNGTVLWTMEIPDLWRVNMPRDSSNWCADEQRLYVTIRDRVWALDGQTGELTTTYRLPGAAAGKTHDWGYVARVGDKLYGARVKKGSFYTGWWGKGAWYDGAGGGSANKICSDELFACDEKTGKTAWTYNGGIIINPTIAIGAGRVYFVETRNAAVKAAGGGRLGANEMWSDRHLVALDANTGRKLWDTDVTGTPRGVAVYYLAYAGERVVVMASDQGKYHLNVYGAADGKPAWQASHRWTGSNHGGHMQRPVVTDKAVYQAPTGYDLQTGKALAGKMAGAGCGTYAGGSNVLLMRSGGNSSMWDMRTAQASSWVWLRPSCWLSLIPAGGMVLAPEGGGGCSCGRWMETSMGFMPCAAQGLPRVKGKN